MCHPPRLWGIFGAGPPARVDQARGAFHPPLRKVTFNRLIQQNDGIVANYVAQREGLSYPDALAALEKEIDAWNRRLKNDLLIVPGIGEFSLTAEDKLRFLPYEKFNFDLSATGLSTFYRKPPRSTPTSGRCGPACYSFTF